MIQHDKVKKYSAEAIDTLKEMEDLVSKFKPKTDNYDAAIGDDISAKAKVLMEEILKTVKELRREVEKQNANAEIEQLPEILQPSVETYKNKFKPGSPFELNPGGN